jgi:hypothetical protein
MPDPSVKSAPTVQMKKTQPLISMPTLGPQSASIAVEPARGSTMAEGIPTSICWTVLGASAVILIIQIWTYLS